ncbi:MAG TPA: tRNA epoxyqueuosine(34) reductase QueG [Polyangiaceae bacterium]|nr:tRNA epoxyqueuosine(34) reductase QueG [Polyangiaceae bacterium]
MAREPGKARKPAEVAGVREYLPAGSASAAVSTSSPSGGALAAAIHRRAQDLGFVRIGFAGVAKFTGPSEELQRWLAQGHQGEMQYLEGPEDRADPLSLFAGARSMIVAALAYPSPQPLKGSPDPLKGVVANYARSDDYHNLIREKLRTLAQSIADLVGRTVRGRVCVDTAPLLEREAARQAGIAFIGKNTMAIAPSVGSNILLGSLLIDVDLPQATPLTDGCGSCRLCLEACPTQAFTGPRQLDARRCISYLTIELRAAVPLSLRTAVGPHVFGCDICQQVCPYNQSPKNRALGSQLVPKERLISPDLLGWLDLTAGDYRRLVKGTALRRTSQQRLQRNAAVALGNSKSPKAVPRLAHQLKTSRSTLIRQHSAWALGQIGGAEARAALDLALADPAAEVREEAQLAIEEIDVNSNN